MSLHYYLLSTNVVTHLTQTCFSTKMGELTSIRNNLYIHQCDLQENLQLEPVLDDMRAKKALTVQQLEEIAACMKPTEKTDRLTHILKEGTDDSLLAFINSLQDSGQVPLQMIISGINCI